MFREMRRNRQLMSRRIRRPFGRAQWGFGVFSDDNYPMRFAQL
jgi:hypothetical protein